jgi:hypothetical protein
VNMGSKMRSSVPAAIPGPESSTMVNTPPFGSGSVMTRKIRGEPGDALIASIAFITRFTVTCCN